MRTHKASPSCIIIPFLYKAACKTYAPASRNSSQYWSRQPAKAGHGPYDDGLRKQRSGATAIRQGHLSLCRSGMDFPPVPDNPAGLRKEYLPIHLIRQRSVLQIRKGHQGHREYCSQPVGNRSTDAWEHVYRPPGTGVPAVSVAEKVLTIQPPESASGSASGIRFARTGILRMSLQIICPYIWRISCSFPSSMRKVVPFPISELFTKILP